MSNANATVAHESKSNSFVTPDARRIVAEWASRGLIYAIGAECTVLRSQVEDDLACRSTNYSPEYALNRVAMEALKRYIMSRGVAVEECWDRPSTLRVEGTLLKVRANKGGCYLLASPSQLNEHYDVCVLVKVLNDRIVSDGFITKEEFDKHTVTPAGTSLPLFDRYGEQRDVHILRVDAVVIDEGEMQVA